jgi:hypothetical protein
MRDLSGRAMEGFELLDAELRQGQFMEQLPSGPHVIFHHELLEALLTIPNMGRECRQAFPVSISLPLKVNTFHPCIPLLHVYIIIVSIRKPLHFPKEPGRSFPETNGTAFMQILVMTEIAGFAGNCAQCGEA